MSNVNKWNDWYKTLGKEPAMNYGGVATYKIGADFLADCPKVEDWGTGSGAFKLFRSDAIGVDGSITPHASIQADLITYKSNCDGIMLRHVLEHNFDWKQILKNALVSARKVVVVCFAPLSESASVEMLATSAANRRAGVDAPTISLGREELLEVLADSKFTETNVDTETVFLITTNKKIVEPPKVRKEKYEGIKL